MNCEHSSNPELAEKYVTGQLPEAEMSAFEEHYFGCDECLQAVQLLQAVRTGVTKTSPKVIVMPGAARKPSRWLYVAVAAAAVIAVSLIGWRSLSGRPEARPPEVAQKPQPTTTAPAPQPQAAVSTEPVLMASNMPELGAIIPLPYRASVLRGVSEDAGQRFDAAMGAYQRGDYRQAVAGLVKIPVGVPDSAKPEEHVTDAGVQMYLGIGQLMLNQNADAVRSLRRASAYGDTPYMESAVFYLAKALIREQQPKAAAVELRRLADLNGDRQSEAQGLLKQLESIR